MVLWANEPGQGAEECDCECYEALVHAYQHPPWGATMFDVLDHKMFEGFSLLSCDTIMIVILLQWCHNICRGSKVTWVWPCAVCILAQGFRPRVNRGDEMSCDIMWLSCDSLVKSMVHLTQSYIILEILNLHTNFCNVYSNCIPCKHL